MPNLVHIGARKVAAIALSRSAQNGKYVIEDGTVRRDIGLGAFVMAVSQPDGVFLVGGRQHEEEKLRVLLLVFAT